MLRTFLVEDASGKRAIVTEVDMPSTASGDWKIVRELGALKDPIQQVAAVFARYEPTAAAAGAEALLAVPPVVLPGQSAGAAAPKNSSILLLVLAAAAAILFFNRGA